jgi:hypothetical protein
MIERTITKSIRFSLAEYEQVISELEKTNLSFSSFTRNLLLKKKINSKLDDLLIKEINRIGNNLNQIARAVNKQERINVLSELVKIEQSIKELVNGS